MLLTSLTSFYRLCRPSLTCAHNQSHSMRTHGSTPTTTHTRGATTDPMRSPHSHDSLNTPITHPKPPLTGHPSPGITHNQRTHHTRAQTTSTPHTTHTYSFTPEWGPTITAVSLTSSRTFISKTGLSKEFNWVSLPAFTHLNVSFNRQPPCRMTATRHLCSQRAPPRPPEAQSESS